MIVIPYVKTTFVEGAAPGISAIEMNKIGTGIEDATTKADAYTAADVLAKLKTVDGAGSGVDAALFDGLASTVFVRKTLPAGADMNAVVQTGFYDGSGVTNAPSVDWHYFIVIAHTSDSPSNRYIQQIAFNFNDNIQYTRQSRGGTGTWTAWAKTWNSTNDSTLAKLIGAAFTGDVSIFRTSADAKLTISTSTSGSPQIILGANGVNNAVLWVDRNEAGFLKFDSGGATRLKIRSDNGTLIPSGHIELGVDRLTSSLSLGGFGHTIGRRSSDGALLIGGGQASIVMQNPITMEGVGDTISMGNDNPLIFQDGNLYIKSLNSLVELGSWGNPVVKITSTGATYELHHAGNKPYTTGTYTGNGPSNRSINTGYNPSAVFVYPSGATTGAPIVTTYTTANSGLAVSGSELINASNLHFLGVGAGGFFVDGELNKGGFIYNYIAFKQ